MKSIRPAAAILAVSAVTAAALTSAAPASAAPTWLGTNSVSGHVLVPHDAQVVVAENGHAAATWAREVNGLDRIYASYGSGGGWTTPEVVSVPAAVVADPGVAINHSGVAYVTWRQQDPDNVWRVAASRHLGSGDYGTAQFVSAPAVLDVAAAARTDVDGNGVLHVAHTVGTGVDARPRLSRWTGSTPASTTALGQIRGSSVDVSANRDGDLLTSWLEYDGTTSIRTRKYDAGTKTWAAATTPVTDAVISNDSIQVELGDSGIGTLAYLKQIGGFNRVTAHTYLDDGKPSPATVVTATMLPSASGLSLAQNNAGTAVVSWTNVGFGNRVGWAFRQQGSWSAPTMGQPPLTTPTRTHAAISDNNAALIGYVDDGGLFAHHGPAGGPLTWHDTGLSGVHPNEGSAGTDDQGNGFIAAVVQSPEPAFGSVQALILDNAGPVTTLAPLTGNTIGTAWSLKHSANDRLSKVVGTDIRVRRAPWNGTFGGFSTVAADVEQGTVTPFSASPGRTYCFSARSSDGNGTLGGFSAERCTTTPVDDRALKMAGGFSRKNGGAHYRGTFTQATKNGATLTLKNVKASRIAILVTKVAAGGKIQVKFGTKILGTYSLKGSGLKQLVAQKSLGGLKTGTLTIKVVSASGKVVKIDGVVAAK